MAFCIPERSKARVRWDRNPSIDVNEYYGWGPERVAVPSRPEYKTMEITFKVGCREYWLEQWARELGGIGDFRKRDLNLIQLDDREYEFRPTSIPGPGSVVAEGCFVLSVEASKPSNEVKVIVHVSSVNVIAKCHLPEEIIIDGFKYRRVD